MPVDLSDIAALAAGEQHSLALASDGKVYAWGRNDQGQLGDGSTTDTAQPVLVAVPASVTITKISAGAYHNLALDSYNNVWAWGMNDAGQLGNGENSNRLSPIIVASLAGVSAIGAGYKHSLAAKLSNGAVLAWGWNYHGQLGDGTHANRNTPVTLGIVGVSAVSGGEKHSIALKGDTVWAWGSNGKGQLGRNGNESLKPVQVQQTGGSKALTGITAISAGALHNLALKSDKTVWSWGYDQSGQLGDNANKVDQNRAVRVFGISGIEAIAAGGYHSLAKTDGEMWAWGGNWLGQLGDGTTGQHSVPKHLDGLTGVSALGGGVWAKHTLIAQ